MEKKQNVPALRFQGFSSEWKLHSLNYYLRVAGEKNGNGYWNKDDVLSVSGEHGIVNQLRLKGRSFAGVSVLNYGVVHKGDVVYTKSPLKETPYGIIKTNKGKDGIVSTLYAVYAPKNTVDSDFVQCYFDSNTRLNNYLKALVNKGAKNDMKVSDENALLGSVIFPDKIEQEQLAKFGELFDKVVSLKRKKVIGMQRFRQAMLTKLFPREGAAEPELRFRGFSGKWKQKKLGDLVVRITRKNSNMESDLPLTISAVLGLVSQQEYFNNRVASGDVSRYYLIKRGEFAYNKSYSDGYPFGAVKRLDKYDKGVLSTLYIIFSPKKYAVQSDYLAAYYDTTGWYKEVAARAAEGARNHGLLNISPDDFFDTMLKLPESKEEQQQIGTFFKNLDDFISLQQKKLERMQRLKAALLEKMFV